MKKPDLVYIDYCQCGKLKFNSEAEVAAFLRKKGLISKRTWYICRLSETYHVTHYKKKKSGKKGVAYGNRHFKFNPKLVEINLHLEEEERKKMEIAKMSVRRLILHIMQEMYEKEGITSTTTPKLTERIREYRPDAKTNQISAMVSHLKTDGQLRETGSLKVSVRGGIPAKVIALASVIDKEKAKGNDIMTPKKSNESEVKEVTLEKPKPTVANPFDKVFERFNGIEDQVTSIAVALNSLLNSTKPSMTEERLKEVFEEVQTPRVNHLYDAIVRSYDGIFGAVAKTAEESRKNSNRLAASIADIVEAMSSNKGGPIPANASDDYKQGIKDGIRMAIELGLSSDSSDS